MNEQAVEIIDRDAIEIGELYTEARSSIVQSVTKLIGCGERLIAKKAKLSHGEWLPWLADNANVLGFESDRTARMLMEAAKRNRKLTSDLEPAEALRISREIWGNEKRDAKEAEREARRQANRDLIASGTIATIHDLIAGGVKVATIVADPPWDWGDEGDQDQLGRARPDFATMSIDELLDYPVGEIADVDCHLYCWITNRSLPKGFALIERWGFRYVTMLTWGKPSFGMGNYFRGQTEHLLFCVKGSQPLLTKDAGTLFLADRAGDGHSRKPPELNRLVDRCSPGPVAELFSRSDWPGWIQCGENIRAAA